jgi:FtsZ-interacting cell division protein ZipA
MNPLATLTILADGWGNIAFPLIVLIFAILGSIFKKKAEQGQQDVEQKRKTGRQDENDDGWITVEADEPARMRESGQQRHLREPAPVIENRSRNTRTQQTPPPRRRRQAQASVDQLPPPPPTKRQPTAPQAAAATPRHSQSNVSVRVNLTNPKTAKAAIIFSEILSPPKALRKGPERWDM